MLDAHFTETGKGQLFLAEVAELFFFFCVYLLGNLKNLNIGFK